MEVVDILEVLEEHKKELERKAKKEQMEKEFSQVKDWLIQGICYDIADHYDETLMGTPTEPKTYALNLSTNHIYLSKDIICALSDYLMEHDIVVMEVNLKSEPMSLVGNYEFPITIDVWLLEIVVDLDQFLLKSLK